MFTISFDRWLVECRVDFRFLVVKSPVTRENMIVCTVFPFVARGNLRLNKAPWHQDCRVWTPQWRKPREHPTNPGPSLQNMETLFNTPCTSQSRALPVEYQQCFFIPAKVQPFTQRFLGLPYNAISMRENSKIWFDFLWFLWLFPCLEVQVLFSWL